MSIIIPDYTVLITVYSKFEIWNYEFTNFVLIFTVPLTILGPLDFHINFKIDLSNSVEKPDGILKGITFNL